MNVKEKEIEIVEILYSDDSLRNSDKIFRCHFYSGRDIRNSANRYYMKVFQEGSVTVIKLSSMEIESKIWDIFSDILLNSAEQEKLHSDVELIINPDGTHEAHYWYDEKRLNKEEYDIVSLTACTFPDSMANFLVNFYLSQMVKFKRKYERIIWVLWVEDGKPLYKLYTLNKKIKKLILNLQKNIQKIVRVNY